MLTKSLHILLATWVLAVAAIPLHANAKLELAAPFTDHMVLQRGKPVPVWGADQPGTTVTVTFAGQKHSAVAGKDGEWMLKLDPLTASADGRAFTASNDRNDSITLNDVLVGEVWFSSGQSNMVWIAGKSMCRDLAREISSSEADIPIREISIDTVSAIYPQKRATTEGWKTHKGASNFSALSLSFAHDLYQELKVPIGILLSAHSNTRVEAFTARPSIEAHSELTGDAELIHLGDPLTNKGAASFKQYETDLRAWQQEAIVTSKAGGDIPSHPNLPGIAGMWRGPSQFFSGKINPVVPYAIKGAIWCQGTSNSDDGEIYAARMEALVRGWRDAWEMPDMPFYFTQMQCYGSADSGPDKVGFADIRQAQFKFFLNNRENVGMVVQSDLNSARPEGIHYYNKLHPGMRMARWALANDYGKDTAFTGPIYQGYEVKGKQVIVLFEKGSLFGGLMVGSKGMAADVKEPGKYVEPAQPTPNEALNHFRLCGKDGQWHAAEARIDGDTVVVTSDKVSTPTGVQYAYSAVPMNSNLYNSAGLPATPFAAVDGKLIFQEPRQHRQRDSSQPFIQVANYFRDGAIIQRDQALPVWGHANADAKVTVTLGEQSLTTTANSLEQWSVTFPPMSASSQAITLEVSTDRDTSRTIKDILVGDVWFLTGDGNLNSEMAMNLRDEEAAVPATLPLVREFRRKTKASNHPTARKRWFETGGGKYRSSWIEADFSDDKEGITMFAYHFARALNRPGIPQGFITMSAGRNGRPPQYATPLSWTGLDAVENIDDPAFKARIDELMLQYPHSKVAMAAFENHLSEVKATVQQIVDIHAGNGDLSTAPLGFPSFPVSGIKDSDVPRDMIPTYTYNWCIAPFTPMATAGVIWVPAEANIGPEPNIYAKELEIFARSLPATFGQNGLPFYYAHPTPSLVDGISTPNLPEAKATSIDAWPSSFQALATKMAELAR